ncbi:MAG: LytTR family DNA-binding domain-containing protein [Bacteroidales bacterium]|nr:LytTR family DNA-binding domain-containing protein [Bacteroidales bacterium]
MTIKVLAIDDEPLALRKLELFISQVPYLELVAACNGARQAAPVLEQEEVDALFLDINMPDLSGMDFFRSLAKPPMVVFTTAYSDYAVEGFRVNAVDYLLKPFGMKEFREAAERLRLRMEAQAAEKPATVQDKTIIFKADRKTVQIPLDKIRYVEGMSEYIKVHHDGAPLPLIVLMRMKILVERLPADRFLRIHRSYIVNLTRIREVGRSELRLDDGTVIPVGDLYRPALRDYLEKR